ncbi:MAG: GntR family transcriptional regulator [Firmicutes bacterium]|nr:GntR family transcriptional regulator [Bacillota bacterium]
MNKPLNKTLDVVKDIQDKIINNSLKSEDKLLPLRELAISYNTSRSVINAAIHILSTKGYVSVSSRHFVVVNDFLYSGSLDVVRDIYSQSRGTLRKKTIEEVLSIRKLVELDALDNIIINRRNIDKLNEILRLEINWVEKEKENLEEICNLDCEFHECLVKTSGNAVLFLLYRSFKDIEHDLVRRFYESKHEVMNVVSSHKALIFAIESQNIVDSKNIWRNLLEEGEKVVLSGKT